MITFNDVKNDASIRTYIIKADESLRALGYTEHSFAHVTKVSETASYILEKLPTRKEKSSLPESPLSCTTSATWSTAAITRKAGAVMAFRILDHLGMPADELAQVVSAIGNHDEGTGVAVNPISAALILADKSDVRRSRVRNTDMSTFDIHDRVNYSVENSELTITRKTPR